MLNLRLHKDRIKFLLFNRLYQQEILDLQQIKTLVVDKLAKNHQDSKESLIKVNF